MADITFKTEKDFGSIGGKKKLTFTSWNGNKPRYDIRDWYDNGSAGKGITLDKDELKTLYGLLSDIFDNDLPDFDASSLDDIESMQEPIGEVYGQNIFNVLQGPWEKKFEELDKLFKGFEVVKEYGKMPFADGDRLGYSVKKDKKKFPDYEKKVEELGLKSFITNKGNLYIYEL